MTGYALQSIDVDSVPLLRTNGILRFFGTERLAKFVTLLHSFLIGDLNGREVLERLHLLVHNMERRGTEHCGVRPFIVNGNQVAREVW